MPQYLSPGVYVEEVATGSRPIEGVGTAVAAFIGMASTGPVNEPTLITNWSQFTNTFGPPVEGSHLHGAVYGYLLNGGGAAYVVGVGSNGREAPRARAELTGSNASPGYRITALDGGPAGNDIVVETSAATASGEDTFKLVVSRAGRQVETFDNVSTRKGKTNVATVVREQSKLIAVEEIGTAAPAERLPAPGRVGLSGGTLTAPLRLTSTDYVGDPADRTGLSGLEAVDAVTMVAAPDLMIAYQRGIIELDAVLAVQQAMIAHCELMGDRLAILDPLPGLNAQQVREWRMDKAGYDSKYAALYWPWINVFDPVTGRPQAVPPSGHMAGIWARTDADRGVHKAPANEVIRGALSLELQTTRAERDTLNPVGINCLCAFPGRGIRVWGARTLASDSSWRYINVRRLFNYIESSILLGTQWVVFEPNDRDLWARVRRTIDGFLTRLWRDGALFGASTNEAFYVKCDSETNPPEVIDAGQLVVEVGIAPVKPAEFVVFRLSQFSGGASLAEA